ncbi:MAG: hypothetical protein CL610_13225 [Anaerolineaceae bacterium]|nr:hypothetical protein [Anaerolineaceae bacterium]
MIPRHVWVEMCDDAEHEACDVIVEMEDGRVYTAMFVTQPYLDHQMDFNYQMSKQQPDVPLVRYAALDSPHILVENLSRDTLEDTVDNMIALDVFEGFFTLVTDEEPENGRTTNNGKRATTQVAAVVINEVLTVDGE